MRIFCTATVERTQNKETYLSLFGRDGATGKTCCVHVRNIWRHIFFVPEDQDLFDKMDPATFRQLLRSALVMQMPRLQKVRDITLETGQRWIDPDHDLFTDATTGFARRLRAWCFRYPWETTLSSPLALATDCPILNVDGIGRIYVKTSGLSLQETFAASTGMKGACWMDVNKARMSLSSEMQSYCQMEVTVDCADVSAYKEGDLPDPPLKVLTLQYYMHSLPGDKYSVPFMAMSVRQVSIPASLPFSSGIDVDSLDLNPFIKSACGGVASSADSMQTTDETTHQEATFYTWVPKDKLAEARSKLPSDITICSDEKSLFGKLLNTLLEEDPDIVLSNNINRDWIRLLFHHIRSLGLASEVAKLGRLKSSVGVTQVGQGRVYVDVLRCAREFLLTRNWKSLATMLNRDYDSKMDNHCTLNDGSSRIANLPAVAKQFVQQHDILFDAAVNLNLLFLSKQIATIYGCTWNLIFHGSKPERTAAILIHEFYAAKVWTPERDLMLQNKSDPFFQPVKDEELDDEEADDTEAEPLLSSTKKNAPQYAGGYNLEPKPGIYDVSTHGYTLLLDYASLYPSMICENDLCLVNIRAHRQQIQPGLKATPTYMRTVKQAMAPSRQQNDSIIPKVQLALVLLRAKVKAAIKKTDASAERARQILAVVEKAFKLVANTGYGAIGAKQKNFRFRCTSAAALIALCGQSFLMHAIQMCKRHGLDAIFGDTDSLMLTSGTSDLHKAIGMANDITKAVGEGFDHVRFALDSIFRKVVLYRKKKYAFAEISLNGTTEIGWKGLEIVRSDWCALAQMSCRWVMETILYETSANCIVSKICQLITGMQKAYEYMCAHDMDSFIMTESLDKPLNKYSENAQETSPHLIVARRMLEGGHILTSKEQISYIVCESEDNKNTPLGHRCFHPDVVETNGYKPDMRYYMTTQILPPLQRLCSLLKPDIVRDLNEMFRTLAPSK